LSKKTLVFGLGTGRCGTTSLAKLLNAQPNTLVTHELSPILPWTPNFEMLQYRILQLEHQVHADFIGDVGSYYLPYVTPLIKSMINEKFNLKFVVLKRNMNDTVSSFLRKNESYNRLQAHDGTKWKQDPHWDNSFPTYSSDLTKKQAAELRWHEYYDVANTIEDNFDNVRIFNIEDLNSDLGVNSILDFIGIDNKNIVTNIKINEGI